MDQNINMADVAIFDKDMEKILPGKVRSILATDKDTGISGAVEFELVIQEAANRAGAIGSQLPAIKGGTTAAPTILTARTTPDFRWAKASPGVYRWNNVNHTADDLREWIWEWENQEWTLKEMTRYPDNSAKIEEAVSGVSYSKGTVKTIGTTLYRAKVTTAQLPSATATDWEVLGSNLKLDQTGGALSYDSFNTNTKKVPVYTVHGPEYFTVTIQAPYRDIVPLFVPSGTKIIVSVYSQSVGQDMGYLTDKLGGTVRYQVFKGLGPDVKTGIEHTVKQDSYLYLANYISNDRTDYSLSIWDGATTVDKKIYLTEEDKAQIIADSKITFKGITANANAETISINLSEQDRTDYIVNQGTQVVNISFVNAPQVKTFNVIVHPYNAAPSINFPDVEFADPYTVELNKTALFTITTFDGGLTYFGTHIANLNSISKNILIDNFKIEGTKPTRAGYEISGTWVPEFSNNKIIRKSGTVNGNLYYETNKQEYIVSARFKGFMASRNALLVGMNGDNFATFTLIADNVNTGKLRLIFEQNASFDTLVSNLTPDSTRIYEMKVKKTGSTISLYLDGALIRSYAASVLPLISPSTKTGFRFTNVFTTVEILEFKINTRP